MPQSARRVWLQAVLLCVLPIAVAFALAPASASLGERYLRLLNWDSFHYVDIVDNGYHVVANPTSDDVHGGRANAVFFPGYPWVATAVHAAGVPTRWALLLVAQAAALGFWVYFLLLVRGGSDVSDERRRLKAAALVLAFPAAFFLVVAYTESLFLFSLLGFVYWYSRWRERGSAADWGLAAVHGILMTGTRIVGIGVALFPVIDLAARAWGRHRSPVGRKFFEGAILTAVSLAGTAAFFFYCAQKLGRWDMYFHLEEVGWKNFTEPLVLLDPRSYIPHFFFEHTVDSISRSAVPFIAGVFVLAGVGEWRAGKRDLPTAFATSSPRLAWYFSAFFMFQIAAAAKANANMDSMIRYTFPVFVLLVIAVADLAKEREAIDRPLRIGSRARMVFWAGTAVSVATQLWMIFRFLRGRWVA